MTVNEAIAQFQERLSIKDYREQIPEYYEAMELAIKVFEEIQQYRELGAVEEIAYCIKQSEEEFNMLIEYLHIGTIEEFKELKEKSMAKHIEIQQWIDTKCVCGHIFSKHYGDGYHTVPYQNRTKHCPNCGQKLDWKEVAE